VRVWVGIAMLHVHAVFCCGLTRLVLYCVVVVAAAVSCSLYSSQATLTHGWGANPQKGTGFGLVFRTET
jgi:hypothetical protein